MIRHAIAALMIVSLTAGQANAWRLWTPRPPTSRATVKAYLKQHPALRKKMRATRFRWSPEAKGNLKCVGIASAVLGAASGLLIGAVLTGDSSYASSPELASYVGRGLIWAGRLGVAASGLFGGTGLLIVRSDNQYFRRTLRADLLRTHIAAERAAGRAVPDEKTLQGWDYHLRTGAELYTY